MAITGIANEGAQDRSAAAWGHMHGGSLVTSSGTEIICKRMWAGRQKNFKFELGEI